MNPLESKTELTTMRWDAEHILKEFVTSDHHGLYRFVNMQSIYHRFYRTSISLNETIIDWHKEEESM